MAGSLGFGIFPTIYRAQNPETPKSLKKVSQEEFGTPDSKPPKSSEKSPKIHKIVKINYFELLSGDLFETFRGLELRPLNPRSSWAPRAQELLNGVENEFPGPSSPGGQKVKNGVKKESKKLIKS